MLPLGGSGGIELSELLMPLGSSGGCELACEISADTLDALALSVELEAFEAPDVPVQPAKAITALKNTAVVAAPMLNVRTEFFTVIISLKSFPSVAHMIRRQP